MPAWPSERPDVQVRKTSVSEQAGKPPVNSNAPPAATCSNVSAVSSEAHKTVSFSTSSTFGNTQNFHSFSNSIPLNDAVTRRMQAAASVHGGNAMSNCATSCNVPGCTFSKSLLLSTMNVPSVFSNVHCRRPAEMASRPKCDRMMRSAKCVPARRLRYFPAEHNRTESPV